MTRDLQQVKTFEEKRLLLLEDYDKCAAELRKVVADPKWTNEDYPPFKKALNELVWATKHLKLLNEAEQL